MSYSPRGADNWIAEQQHEIERQHREITDLKIQLHDKEVDSDNLTRRLNNALTQAEGLGRDADEFGKLADRLSAAISSAIADLRVLGEVPFSQLEDAVKAIADRLADQNGERY